MDRKQAHEEAFRLLTRCKENGCFAEVVELLQKADGCEIARGEIAALRDQVQMWSDRELTAIEILKGNAAILITSSGIGLLAHADNARQRIAQLQHELAEANRTIEIVIDQRQRNEAALTSSLERERLVWEKLAAERERAEKAEARLNIVTTAECGHHWLRCEFSGCPVCAMKEGGAIRISDLEQQIACLTQDRHRLVRAIDPMSETRSTERTVESLEQWLVDERAEAKRITQERDFFKTCVESKIQSLEVLYQLVATLTIKRGAHAKDAAALREALERYGQHEEGCLIFLHKRGFAKHDCTCGLSAALGASTTAGEKH